MLTITEYSAELVKDPFGILSGQRYEFLLQLAVPEDDELYSENGLYAKIVYRVDENRTGIVTCDLYERTTDKYVGFDIEEEERAALAAFCAEHLPEA